MTHETMTGEQFAQCMADEEIGDASTTALFDSHMEEKE